jgi:hypothetical protein
MMAGDILQVGELKQQRNFVPLPYRRVSFQPYQGKMTEAVIVEHLLNREVYRRTDVIVLHNTDNQYAVAAVQRLDSENLFTRLVAVEVLALPADCVYLHDANTDAANPSALAKLARLHGVSKTQTAIVEGKFDHINIIHHPDPIRLRVVEVTPPDPPKLLALVEQVLSYADLPPIEPMLEAIDLCELSQQVKPDSFLVPCRSGGLDELGVPVHFLDERPAKRENSTLIGCERSLQFHRHYYGDEPPRVEMCPRQLTQNNALPTLLKCCLLEFAIETEHNKVIVPWGADLPMIEQALQQIVRMVNHD